MLRKSFGLGIFAFGSRVFRRVRLKLSHRLAHRLARSVFGQGRIIPRSVLKIYANIFKDKSLCKDTVSFKKHGRVFGWKGQRKIAIAECIGSLRKTYAHDCPVVRGGIFHPPEQKTDESVIGVKRTGEIKRGKGASSLTAVEKQNVAVVVQVQLQTAQNSVGRKMDFENEYTLSLALPAHKSAVIGSITADGERTEEKQNTKQKKCLFAQDRITFSMWNMY